MTLCKQVNRSDSFNEVVLKQVLIENEDNDICDDNLDDIIIIMIIIIDRGPKMRKIDRMKCMLTNTMMVLFLESLIMRELDKLNLF